MRAVILTNSNGERFMERTLPRAKDLASRDVVSRSMTMEIREGRGVGREKDHVFLHLDHLDPKIFWLSACRESPKAPRYSLASTCAGSHPGHPTVHYNMGGIPTNYHGEVLTLKNGNPDTVVPGLMAIGEAACVSVHGANRLGSNSLIDLVVFGRAAGLARAETVEARTAHTDLPGDATDFGLVSTASVTPRAAPPTAALRLRMQRVMQNNCAVFRDGPVLVEGVREDRPDLA